MGQSYLFIFFTSLIFLLTKSCLGQVCRDGGTFFNGRCFWMIDTKLRWDEANLACNHMFGDHVTLAIVKDQETNDFIRSQTVSTIWLGLHEGHGETIWTWLDNTAPNYTNWEENRPSQDSTSDNCAVMYRGGNQWRDLGCKKRYRFVCSELPSAPICPNGGTFFRDRCYWQGHGAAEWETANMACSRFGRGVQLVVVRDAEVNEFLSRLVYPSIWLGLSDRARERRFQWVDGTELTYSNWRRGEPNNIDNEDCAVLSYGDGVWNDQMCEENWNKFICALPPCEASEVIVEPDDYWSVSSSSGWKDKDDVANNDDVTGNGGSDNNQHHQTVSCSTACTCVTGGACLHTGECRCVKQFPAMVCDKGDFELTMTTKIETERITEGTNVTIECHYNIPAEDVAIEWSRESSASMPWNRTDVINEPWQGLSVLEITNVTVQDADTYQCAASYVIGQEPARRTVTTNLRVKASRKEEENVIKPEGDEEETADKETVNLINTGKLNQKEASSGVKESASPVISVVIVAMSIVIGVLFVAVVLLVAKVRKLEGSTFGIGRLVEMNDVRF